MNEFEKKFILNKGLYLGSLLSVFPILDLFYGETMPLTTYYIIFKFLGFLIILSCLCYFTKEYKIYLDSQKQDEFYNKYSFKRFFKLIFLISCASLIVLTCTRISTWSIMYPSKYIEINEKRTTKTANYFLSFSQSAIDEKYKEGQIDSDTYEELNEDIENSKEQLNDELGRRFDEFKLSGLSNFYFINKLVEDVFLMALLSSIIALFFRKKQI